MPHGPRSAELFERARRVIPGGVDSPVRAFGAVGGSPQFIVGGDGAYVTDADGHRRVDLVCTWGANILGHADPEVTAAITEAVRGGTAFGAPHQLEVELAELIVSALPSVEMLRFVTSGTEAVMSALRLARAHTRRDLVVKFDGCYHGHSDGLLAAAGSGVATLGIPGSPGVPPSVAATTISLPFNDLSAVERTLQRHSGHIAAVIVEPIPCNMGVVPARPGYLEGLRRLTRQHDVLLIFDEVISGFRAGWGGAQGLCGVEPDLTCLGKVIGGGLPVGAYGGRRDLMELIAPSGPVYQAGTLAGSPPAMAAGVVTLRRLRDTDVFARLRASAAALTSALSQVVAGSPPPARVAQQASLMTLFFSSEPVTDYSSARAADTTRYAAFFHRMLEAGVSLPPSQFEAWFLTAAHGEAEIAHVVEAAEAALSTGALPARAG